MFLWTLTASVNTARNGILTWLTDVFSAMNILLPIGALHDQSWRRFGLPECFLVSSNLSQKVYSPASHSAVVDINLIVDERFRSPQRSYGVKWTKISRKTTRLNHGACMYGFLFMINKSAHSNLGRGPRRGGLQPACVAVRVSECAVAFIHEYACYAGNVYA